MSLEYYFSKWYLLNMIEWSLIRRVREIGLQPPDEIARAVCVP